MIWWPRMVIPVYADFLEVNKSIFCYWWAKCCLSDALRKKFGLKDNRCFHFVVWSKCLLQKGQIKSLMGSVKDHLSVFKSTCSWELDFSSLTENCRTIDAAIFVRLWWLKRSQKSAKRQVYLKVLLLPRTEYSWFT